MSKLDTKKVAKRARDTYEWSTDSTPSKKQRKQKRKERQDGKKEIQQDRPCCAEEVCWRHAPMDFSVLIPNGVKLFNRIKKLKD